MISQRAKYGLRALVALSRTRSGPPLQILEIAREQAIPKKFLEQILLELKRHHHHYEFSRPDSLVRQLLHRLRKFQLRLGWQGQ